MGPQRQNVDSPTPSAAVIAIQAASLITSPDTSRARARQDVPRRLAGYSGGDIPNPPPVCLSAWLERFARARASPWPTVLGLNKHVSAGRAGYCRIASGRQGLRPVSKSANCGCRLS